MNNRPAGQTTRAVRSRTVGGARFGSQRGQALVLFAVFVAVLAIGVVLLFDTGQLTKKKVRLNNAADAAAYSLAVQQARAMNYAATMNRARAVNEVVVAQAVSLWSVANMWHSHMVYGNAQAHKAVDYTGKCQAGEMYGQTPQYTNFFCGVPTQNGWIPNLVTYPAMLLLFANSHTAHAYYMTHDFSHGTSRLDLRLTIDNVVSKSSDANKHFAQAVDYVFDGLAHFGYFTAQDTVRQFDEHALIAGLNTNGGPDIESVGWAVLRCLAECGVAVRQ